jgi:amidohydrolase
MNSIFFNDVSLIKENLIFWRRHIHQYPEAGFKEVETSSYIIKELSSMGIECHKTVDTGVVALIKGKEGRTLAFRADIDALSLQEENDVSYASTVPGMMHACGHDAHATMLLGVAKVISSKKDLFKGNIKLLFQPAEEGPGGALPMIDAGVLENPHVDAIVALHVIPDIESGKIALKYGQTHAATRSFTVVLKGKSGHAARPDRGVDAIVMSADVIQGFQKIISRQIEPREAALIGIGTIKGGYRSNIIADRVEMEGTIRTLSGDVQKKIPEFMKRVLDGIAISSGGDYEFNYTPGYPPGINHPEFTKFAEETAVKIMGRENVIVLSKSSMGGEDFSYFLQKVPGAFIRLGVGGPDYTYPLHHPKFDLDENALVTGTTLLCQIACDFFNKSDEWRMTIDE